MLFREPALSLHLLGLGCFAYHHICELGSMILRIAVQHVIVHLTFEEDVYVTLPGESDTAVELHRAAG